MTFTRHARRREAGNYQQFSLIMVICLVHHFQSFQFVKGKAWTRHEKDKARCLTCSLTLTDPHIHSPTFTFLVTNSFIHSLTHSLASPFSLTHKLIHIRTHSLNPVFRKAVTLRKMEIKTESDDLEMR